MARGSPELPLRLEVVANDDDGTNHKFPSSVHKVLSNDDLLMEILLRLPIFSLHLFKCVSKQWLSLITSPSFTLTRTRIPTVDPPSGLFIGRSTDSWGPNEYDFVPFDPRIPAKRAIQFSFNSEVQICKSCNGLLLCYIPRHGKYCIYNPLINLFKMLPPKHDLNYEFNGFEDMYMAFDPTKSPCYKVVNVGSVEDVDDDDEFAYSYSVRIQTYSSETGEVHHTRKLYKSHGSLLLLCKDNARSRHLNIYEMKNGYSEWSVKYFVNVDDMMRPFPTWRLPVDWDCYHILSIVLGKQEEDSFVVIELSGNVLQYEFVSETVTKLLDLGKGVRRHDCEEFIASFVHV